LITQSFVFPFLGLPSTIGSPSEPKNLNSISETRPSSIFKLITPSDEILSGPFILDRE